MKDRRTKIGKTYGSKRFHQLAIIVLDGSFSMNDPGNFNMKIKEEVHLAVSGLYTRMKISKVANCFSSTVISFDDSPPKIKFPITPLADVDEHQNFDPTIGHDGGTEIFRALEEAEKVADDFLNGIDEEGVPHSVMILLLSDGLCFDPERTKQVAERIKAKNHIQIATCYFSIKGQPDIDAQELMKSVCSNPAQYYATVYGEETLRNFFIKSLSQSTGSSELMVVNNDRK